MQKLTVEQHLEVVKLFRKAVKTGDITKMVDMFIDGLEELSE